MGAIGGGAIGGEMVAAGKGITRIVLLSRSLATVSLLYVLQSTHGSEDFGIVILLKYTVKSESNLLEKSLK